MSEPTAWVADPRLAWTPTVACTLPAGLDATTLQERLHRINDRLRPGSTSEPVTESDDELDLLRRTSRARAGGPVTAGLGGELLVVSVDHSVGDGASLLAALTEITGVSLTSGFSGVGERAAQHGFVAARVRRLAEVLFSPPAVVPPTTPTSGVPGDAFAARRVPGTHGTTAVIAASAAACAAELVTGRARRRVRIAVGLSTVSGARPALGDHSALLRLSPGTLASPERIRDALRTQGLEPDPGDETYDRRPGLARLTTRVQGALASRLGSTVLVSHLGHVTSAGGGLCDVAFYPVTGGASGLSVGAVVQDGQTLLTARARAARHDAAGLARVLDAVAARLVTG